MSSILSFFIDILYNSSNYNYCNLITNSINEYFSFAQNAPKFIYSLLPSLFEALVYRCILPQECFEAGTLDHYEDKFTLQKFRQSCQDVLLEIATSSIGVYQTATDLFDITHKNTSNLSVQESVLCLFCGIVDSIEEQLLPVISTSQLDYTEEIPNRLQKRIDIPLTPLITDYDSILDFVFQHMEEYLVHPLLLLTALQVMFSFDEWTFSRSSYCSSLYQFLLTAIPLSPMNVIPRLLRYISRLFESPCVTITSTIVHQLLQLSNFIYSLNNTEILTVFLQTISTAICYIPDKEALSLYQEFLQPFMSPLLSFVSTPVTAEITEDHQIIACLKALEACFEGCLVSCLADSLAEAILPTFQALITQAVSLHQQQSSHILTHTICHVCHAILRAADISFSAQNTQILNSISEILIHSSIAISDALEIQDLLVSNSLTHFSLPSLVSMLSTLQSLLSYMLQNHIIPQELDAVKSILRIETVVLKEKAEELTSQESVVLPAIQLVLQVIHENICEEDFIRLILRLLTLFMQVRNRSFFVNCRNIPDFCRLCILNILVVVSSYQECQ